MSEPRAYTPEEIRDRLIRTIRGTAKYWAELPDVDKATGNPLTIEGRCDGVAFSILAMLDGCNMGIPGFDLVAMPAEEDKEDHKENGENWIERGTRLSFAMHEHYHER